MEKLVEGETGALFLLLFLLPGLVGAVVYDFLVEREKPENFDRILEALVLTLVSALAVHATMQLPMVPQSSSGKDTPLPQVIGAFLTTTTLYTTAASVIIAAMVAFLNNRDVFYGSMRRLRLTRKSGAGDVWQDLFYHQRGLWVRLRFADGSMLIGWPQYYSSIGKPRELFLAEATWFAIGDAGLLPGEDVEGPGVYVSNFDNVVSIELLK